MTSETKSADGSSTKADASSIPHFDLRSWVVAGDVLNGEKAAAQVLKRLKNQKYNAVGLNPRLTEDAETKLGIPVKRSFADAANALKTVDVLNLCINSKSGIEILRDAHKKGVQYVFIQPGAESAEILEYCKENKLHTVEACVLRDLPRTATPKL